MRTTTFLFAMAIIAFSNPASANSLVGTWEMTMQHHSLSSPIYIPEDSPVVSMKIFNETHFATIRFDSEGRVGMVNGGTYTFDGDLLIEYLAFAGPYTNQIHTNVEYMIEFRGDDEFQMTTVMPNRTVFTEIWRRVNTANHTNPPYLSGTWDMTSLQVGFQATQYVPENNPIIFKKLLNDTHFATIRYNLNGGVVFVNGGTFTLDGDTYTEHLLFSSPNHATTHTDVEFSINIREDEFDMSTVWENGTIYSESFRRMDPASARYVRIGIPTQERMSRTGIPLPVPVESIRDPRQDDQGIFLEPDEMPQFPGGQEAMMQFLSENLVRPAIPDLQGRVMAQFVIGEDGRIFNIRITQSLSPAHDNEVIRVLQSMPAWIPGTVDGVPVPVLSNIPITFR